MFPFPQFQLSSRDNTVLSKGSFTPLHPEDQWRSLRLTRGSVPTPAGRHHFLLAPQDCTTNDCVFGLAFQQHPFFNEGTITDESPVHYHPLRVCSAHDQYSRRIAACPSHNIGEKCPGFLLWLSEWQHEHGQYWDNLKMNRCPGNNAQWKEDSSKDPCCLFHDAS